MKQELLEIAGLSPNEAKCYRALISLGSASANEISRKSGIHRVAVYDALRGLREKGFISQISKTNKMLFEAANPSIIKDIIEKKQNELEKVKSIIPTLTLDFQMSKDKQEVHSFKGLSGIKTILQKMLDSKTEILDFGAEYKIKEFLPYDYLHWDKERVKRNINMRIIASINIRPTTIAHTQIKYVPKEFNSSVSTYIFDNQVAMIMWVEQPIGILIEHRSVYLSYRNYFEYLWSTAKK